jgi:hypothetical protein
MDDILAWLKDHSDAIQAASTFVTFILAVAVFRIQRKTDFWTGAMAAQQAVLLRIEAKRQDIEVIAWDKSVAPFPQKIKHGETWPLDKIYVGIPVEKRRYRGAWGWLVKSLGG